MRATISTAGKAIFALLMVGLVVLMMARQKTKEATAASDSMPQVSAAETPGLGVNEREDGPPIDVATDASSEKQWWIVDSTFTACIPTRGPAAKLDEFVGLTDKPITRDYRDSNGNLSKVDVVNSNGDGTVSTWTYYKNNSQCESEEVNATKALADKYR